MMELEHMFVLLIAKGVLRKMTDIKMELIKLILENDNPDQAVLTANAIILEILKQIESLGEQTAACLEVFCQANPSLLS